MKRAVLFLLFLPIIGAFFFSQQTNAQQARPATPGVFTIFGTEYTGDGLAPGWQNNSLFNGVNTCNIIEKTEKYQGVHAISCIASAAFEYASLVGPNPIDLAQYKFMNLYGKSTQNGQRYEFGLVGKDGKIVGSWIPLESTGTPLLPDRWSLYSIDLTKFGAAGTPVHGIGIRDMNGAPQPKAFFDEITLEGAPGKAPVISQGLGQPAPPVEPPKPKPPYYPQISPWVFIVPGIIVLLAIFFE